MSEDIWIVTLTLVGGGFEFAGVVLIVKEIASDRRLARQLVEPQDQVVTLDTAEERSQAMPMTVIGGEQPTIEDRVGELERKQARYHRLLEETTYSMRGETMRQVKEAARELARQDKERDEALRRFIHEQLTGGIGWRLAGVGLVLAGIICTTSAGILQVAI